jgi:hypothetical protein
VIAPFFILWTFTAYQGKDLFTAFSRAFSVFNVSPGKAYGLFTMLAVISVIYFFMVNSPLIYFYFETKPGPGHNQ